MWNHSGYSKYKNEDEMRNSSNEKNWKPSTSYGPDVIRQASGKYEREINRQSSMGYDPDNRPASRGYNRDIRQSSDRNNRESSNGYTNKAYETDNGRYDSKFNQSTARSSNYDDQSWKRDYSFYDETENGGSSIFTDTGSKRYQKKAQSTSGVSDSSTMKRRTLRVDEQTITPLPGHKQTPSANKRVGDRKWFVSLVLSILFTLTTIAVIAAAFATELWIETKVDRDGLKPFTLNSTSFKLLYDKDLMYHSSKSGLFRVCYEYVQELRQDNVCLQQTGYELQSRSDVTRGDSYILHYHLMRTQFMAMACALFFLLISLIVSVVACMRLSCGCLYVNIMFTIVSFLCSALSMACFYALDDIEKNKIEEGAYPNAWRLSQQHKLLYQYHIRNHGISVYIGWVGVGLCLVTLFLFCITAFFLKKFKKSMRPIPREDGFLPPAANAETDRSLGRKSAASDGEGSLYYNNAKSMRNEAYDQYDHKVRDADEANDLDAIDEGLFRNH